MSGAGRQKAHTKRHPMKFTVADLKHVAGALRSLIARKGARLSATLHRKQPGLCQIIDGVSMDPRCADAHRVCMVFCALALDHAQGIAKHRLPRYSTATIQEAMCLIAQGRKAQIGGRAFGFPGRIGRHVLLDGEFDEGDTA